MTVDPITGEMAPALYRTAYSLCDATGTVAEAATEALRRHSGGCA